YLAAYAYALEANKGDQEKAKEFVRKLFANVPVFDTGGRAAITTFVEHGIGDVLVTFEAEVQSIGSQYGKDKTDLVIPPVSLRADFPVAVVDKVVDERGSHKLAETYLQYLYTPEAQEIIAAHYNRRIDKEIAAKHANDFANVRLLTVKDVFGGWQKVQEEHLARYSRPALREPLNPCIRAGAERSCRRPKFRVLSDKSASCFRESPQASSVLCAPVGRFARTASQRHGRSPRCAGSSI